MRQSPAGAAARSALTSSLLALSALGAGAGLFGSIPPADAGTPPTVPGAPIEVTAGPEPHGAVVNWDPPTSDGGARITKYTVFATDMTHPADGGQTATTDGSEGQTVGGLTVGDRYTFTVAATNSTGAGPASAPSNAVVPAPSPPPAGITCEHVTGTTSGVVALSSCHSDRQAAGHGTVAGKIFGGGGATGVVSWTSWKHNYSMRVCMTTTRDGAPGGYCAREGFGTLATVHGKVTATSVPDTAVGQSVYGNVCISSTGTVRQAHYGYLQF